MHDGRWATVGCTSGSESEVVAAVYFDDEKSHLHEPSTPLLTHPLAPPARQLTTQKHPHLQYHLLGSLCLEERPFLALREGLYMHLQNNCSL